MKVKVKLLSCVWLFATPWTVAHQAPTSMEFSRKGTGVGCRYVLQRIFLTQGSNPGLSNGRQTLLPSEPPGKWYTVIQSPGKDNFNFEYFKISRDKAIGKLILDTEDNEKKNF